jgi:hypothetical protein
MSRDDFPDRGSRTRPASAGAARARQRETDPHDVIVEQAGIETYFRPVG